MKTCRAFSAYETFHDAIADVSAEPLSAHAYHPGRGLSLRSGLKWLTLSVALLLVAVSSAMAASATWIATGDGAFTTNNNWSPAAAPGTTSATGTADVATFNSTPTSGSAIVTLSGVRGLNSIIFDTAVGSYTLNGGTSYNFQSGGAINLPTTVTTSGQTETINTPIVTVGSFGFNNNATTSDVLVIGGNVTSSSPSTNRTITLGGTNAGANAINGIIANNGTTTTVAISKSGTGSWTLGGANTYSAGTAVTSGTLLVNGVGTGTASSGTGLGNIAISQATGVTTVLGGSGRILGGLAMSGGTITGGTQGAVGMLTLASTASLTGGIYQADIAGATSDRLITGGLTLGGAALTINGSLDGLTTYDIASYVGGTEAGTFTSITGLPSSYTINYAGNGGTEIDLVPVPEPATYVSGLLLTAVAAWCQRGRFGRRSA